MEVLWFYKNYADVKNRYYLVNIYKSERYDDGDYSKFAANQTFYPTSDIQYIALDENVLGFMKKSDMENHLQHIRNL